MADVSVRMKDFFFEPILDLTEINLARWFADPIYQYAFSMHPPLEHIELAETSSIHLKVIHENLTPLGYLKCYYPIAEHCLWIQTLAIDKNYLRQGYGRRIIQTFVKAIDHYHCLQKIYLTCHVDNIVGNAFWLDLGFNPIITSVKKDYLLYEANVRSLL